LCYNENAKENSEHTRVCSMGNRGEKLSTGRIAEINVSDIISL